MAQEQMELTFDAKDVPESRAVYFYHRGEIHVRCIPAKKLFNSSMVHEVVNRGDIFALNLVTGILTVIPGTETPQFVKVVILSNYKKPQE